MRTTEDGWTGRAPGRAEWLGNHTDYNDGLVLGIGLEVGATVEARPTGERQLVLRAVDSDEMRLLRVVRGGGATLMLPR